MVNVFIADDHAVVRQGLKQIISEVSDMQVLGESDNGFEVIDHVKANNYDMVILDITMPGPNILDLVKQIHQISPQMPILVLSIHPEEQYAVRVLRSGASGYLTKESAPEELVNAIRKVAKGGKYVSAALAEKLLFTLGTDQEKLPHDNLSDREYQSLCMIAAGKTVKAIAQDLNLSEKTISTYRSRVLQKMGMKNNAEITHYAFKYGLVN
ncbi:MAG TPA: response regulator transcription factor [Desulfosalsimonadaceae bacterium]|nr:response regulator transcription factor [Desulfosalsimonadaceae bacterium]